MAMSGIAAEILARQRLSLSPTDLDIALRPRDEAAAYALQAETNGFIARKLGVSVGHKIGCTTPVMQKFLGIGNPCAGRVFAQTVFGAHAEISRSHYRKLGVECEIVVEIGKDVEPGRSDHTPQALLPHVGAVMAGIEIVDDRYADYRTLGVQTLIADNFFNAGGALGVPVEGWHDLDLATLEGHMRINGREVGRGTGAMVMGHPLAALAWLANRRCGGLRRGEFVFLGSLVETKWLNAGDDVVIEIERLGQVSLTVSD
jgi:2-oxo-3-hexenedioate decarboxylase/2-keto-4-pentenoate hydratase